METHLQKGPVFSPEKLLHFHVTSMGLPVSKVDIKFVIKRSNGAIQDNMLLERALGFVNRVGPAPLTTYYRLSASDSSGRRNWVSTTVDFTNAPVPTGSWNKSSLTILSSWQE
jgi:hypothetical protein